MIQIQAADCRELMRGQQFDMVLADPPYGDTAIKWDERVVGWLPIAYAALKSTGSMWVFGSMRFFMLTHADFRRAGFRYIQDIVWEKHNGSNMLADRFRRVHESAVQFVRKDAKWKAIFNDPQTTPDAVARTVVRHKRKPAHFGEYGPSSYRSEDGGPKLMRSVIQMRSMHGRAIHPTEKPVELLQILVRTSCPRGGGSRRFLCRQRRRRGGMLGSRAPLFGRRTRPGDGASCQKPIGRPVAHGRLI